MFVNDGLALKMRHGIMDVGAAIALDEKACIRLFGDVLNVDVVTAVFTETLQDHIGFFCCFEWIDKRIFPAGEIIFLNVNDQEGCFHTLSITKRSQRLQSSPSWQKRLEAFDSDIPFFLKLRSHQLG